MLEADNVRYWSLHEW